MSIVVFGWLRPDGTVSWDRDEIIDGVRAAVSEFKNSDLFIDGINRSYDARFKSGCRKPKSVRYSSPAD